MKQTLAVKRESLPVRCEVCHQTDKFNPATGVCRRCNEAFDEPIGLMPWFAIGHWNVPEAFHEEFLEAAGREQVLWVGRPVRRFAEKKLGNYGKMVVLAVLLTSLLTLPVVGILIGSLTGWSAFFSIAAVGIFAFAIHFIDRFFDSRRIDRTLYVLTERRALVMYANRSAPTRNYVVKHCALRRQVVDKHADVGHLIFAELDTLPPGDGTSHAWDGPVRMTLLRNFYPRGFFFIENVGEVERLIHEHVPRRVVETHEGNADR